jgi:isocitrate lyase
MSRETEIRRWMALPRFERIAPNRVWTAEELAGLRGDLPPPEASTFQNALSDKLFDLLSALRSANRHIVTGGVLDGPTAGVMAEAGIPALYFSGWQMSHHWGQPDLAKYPFDTIPNRLKAINKWLYNKHTDQKIRFEKLASDLRHAFREWAREKRAGRNVGSSACLLPLILNDSRIFRDTIHIDGSAFLTPLWGRLDETILQSSPFELIEAAEVELIGHLRSELVDYLVPSFVDADTGHQSVKELTRLLIESGAAASHWEDQVHGLKKCGHMAGKVITSVATHYRRLLEVRKEADKLGSSMVIAARTDAEAAKLLEQNDDPRDHYFILGTENALLHSLSYVIRLARLEVSESDGSEAADAPSHLKAIEAQFPELGQAIRGVWTVRGADSNADFLDSETKVWSEATGQYLGTIADIWAHREAIVNGLSNTVSVQSLAKDLTGRVRTIDELLARQPASLSEQVEATYHLSEVWNRLADLKTFPHLVAERLKASSNPQLLSQWLESTDPRRYVMPLEALKQMAHEFGVDVTWDWEKSRTYEGYYQIDRSLGLLNAALRLRVYARIADVLWMEQEHPDAAQAKEMHDLVCEDPHAQGAFFAINLSPSFNWLNPRNWPDTLNPQDIEAIAAASVSRDFDWQPAEASRDAALPIQKMQQSILGFSERVGACGFQFQFVTVFQDHVSTLAIQKASKMLLTDGAGGYVFGIQAEEHRHRSRFLEHQGAAGVARVFAEDSLVFRGADATAATGSSATAQQFAS